MMRLEISRGAYAVVRASQQVWTCQATSLVPKDDKGRDNTSVTGDEKPRETESKRTNTC